MFNASGFSKQFPEVVATDVQSGDKAIVSTILLSQREGYFSTMIRNSTGVIPTTSTMRRWRVLTEL
jgi:hypothetical protein